VSAAMRKMRAKQWAKHQLKVDEVKLVVQDMGTFLLHTTNCYSRTATQLCMSAACSSTTR
jgi:hypothetical protein